MENRPPALAEALVAVLIPPVCREHVLGDLAERYTTLGRYLRDATGLVPVVVASQAWRNFSPLLVLSEVAMVSLTFWPPFSPMPRRLLACAATLLMALLFRDAYAEPSTRLVAEYQAPALISERRADALFAAALVAMFWDLAFACASVVVVFALLAWWAPQALPAWQATARPMAASLLLIAMPRVALWPPMRRFLGRS